MNKYDEIVSLIERRTLEDIARWNSLTEDEKQIERLSIKNKQHEMEENWIGMLL